MGVRLATEADVPAILEIYAPYVRETAVSFEYAVPTLADFTERFRGITAQFPWLVWEEDGQILGYAYGSLPFERAAFRWSGEVSIYLRPQAQGRGIGKALYSVLEQLLQLQGYRKVYAIVTTANQPSIDFHKAVGYHLTAQMPDCGYKLGQWHGIVWLEKLLNSVEMPTSFPISIWEIVDIDRKLAKILDKMTLS